MDTLRSSDEFDVTVVPADQGGLTGYRVDGTSSDSCGTFVLNVVDFARTVDLGSVFSFLALDDGDGRTIVVHWSGVDAAARADAEAVVNSLQFNVPFPLLAPGTHKSSQWPPGLRYTVGEGWIADGSSDYLELRLANGRATISLWTTLYPPTLRDSPADPHSASDFLDYFSQSPGCGHASRIRMGVINGWRIGGRGGVGCYFEFLRWYGSSPADAWSVPLTIGFEPEMSVVVLDWTADAAMVIDWYAEDAESRAPAEPVVGSFVFADAEADALP